MKLSTEVKAKLYNRGIANLKVQGIKTTADLDKCIAKRPMLQTFGPHKGSLYLMSRFDALCRLASSAVANEILNNLSVQNG